MIISKLKTRIMRLTVYIEFMLAVFIAIAILIGMLDLVKYIVMIFKTDTIQTYEVFQKFLGHTLLLVVGAELIAMLVMHTPGSVIEVLLYAIARSMLIGSKSGLELVLAILSIAGIFAIKKYLFVSKILDGEAINIFSASTSIRDINNSIGVNIPEGLADTAGGLISYLSKQSCREIHEGSYYRISDAEMKVLNYKDGVIERVWVMRFNE